MKSMTDVSCWRKSRPKYGYVGLFFPLKVKPVRDSITQAIQSWKNLPGFDSLEPSEAGSSTKG